MMTQALTDSGTDMEPQDTIVWLETLARRRELFPLEELLLAMLREQIARHTLH